MFKGGLAKSFSICMVAVIFSFLEFTFTQTKDKDFINHQVRCTRQMGYHLGIPAP